MQKKNVLMNHFNELKALINKIDLQEYEEEENKEENAE